MLTRLMGPGGPDLRTLFLPGLEGLKQLLRTFEWLMTRLMPRTQAHLEARPFCASGVQGHILDRAGNWGPGWRLLRSSEAPQPCG